MKNIFKKFLSDEKILPANSNEIFIWPNGAPGSEGKSGKEKSKISLGLKVISNVHNPSLTAFFPSAENATGAAIIIAPGGGHSELWVEHEGYNPAKWFCERGIASFVLKYRLAEESNSSYAITDHSLADIQQAIRFVRSNAKEWNINSAHIGVMGFSAGGEIAGLAAMHFDDGNKNAADKILQQSSFPNFQALIYPGGAHKFKAVKKSPPLFLLCGDDDAIGISKDVAEIYLMYKKAGVSAELHIYANELHGFGIRKDNNAAIAKWPELFIDWLSVKGFI
jgi:acetyl esterase/lipase